jgi:hypothetical protein
VHWNFFFTLAAITTAHIALRAAAWSVRLKLTSGVLVCAVLGLDQRFALADFALADIALAELAFARLLG